MTPDQIATLSAVCAVLAVVSGFLGHILTSRSAAKQNALAAERDNAEQENRVLNLQNELINQIQEERNRQDKKIEDMRTHHANEILEVRQSFEARIAETAAGEAIARQFVATLLPLVPPPPPAPPPGWRP